MNRREAPTQRGNPEIDSGFPLRTQEQSSLSIQLEELLTAIDELVEVALPGSHPEYMQRIKAFSYRHNAEVRVVRYKGTHPDSKEATLYLQCNDQGSTVMREVTHVHIRRTEDGNLFAEQMPTLHGHGDAIEDERRERDALRSEHETVDIEPQLLELRSVTLDEVNDLLEVIQTSATIQ